MRLSEHEAVTRFAEKMTKDQVRLMLETLMTRVTAEVAVEILCYTATTRRLELIAESVRKEQQQRGEAN